MFKVICIKPIVTIENGCESWSRPEVGDIDTVIRQKKLEGQMYYALEGHGKSNGFRADHFATLPEPDANQMKEEEKETIVNLQPA